MRSLRGALTRDNICWIIRDVQRTCKNMRSTKPHNLRPKKQNKKTLKSTSTANRHRASSTSSSTTREVGGGGGGEKESEHTFPVCDPQPGTKIMQEGIVRFLSRSSSPPSFGVQSHWGSGHLITHPKHPDRTSPRRCDIGRGGPVIPPMGPSQPLLQKTLHRATPNKPPYHLQPKPLFLHLRRRDNRSNHSKQSTKPTTPLPNSSPALPTYSVPPILFAQFLQNSPNFCRFLPTCDDDASCLRCGLPKPSSEPAETYLREVGVTAPGVIRCDNCFWVVVCLLRLLRAGGLLLLCLCAKRWRPLLRENHCNLWHGLSSLSSSPLLSSLGSVHKGRV